MSAFYIESECISSEYCLYKFPQMKDRSNCLLKWNFAKVCTIYFSCTACITQKILYFFYKLYWFVSCSLSKSVIVNSPLILSHSLFIRPKSGTSSSVVVVVVFKISKSYCINYTVSFHFLIASHGSCHFLLSVNIWLFIEYGLEGHIVT